MNEPSQRTRAMEAKQRSRGVALSLFFTASALFWTTELWSSFPRNSPMDAALVVAAYATIYGLCFGAPLWLAWRAIVHLLPQPGKLANLPNKLLVNRRGKPNALTYSILALPIISVLGASYLSYLQSTPEPTAALRLQMAIPDSPFRIQLIGIDGADFRYIDRLIEQSELPNFRRFKQLGVFGPLETISPHSPVVWTSIATGRGPIFHGIHQYRTSYLKGTGIAIPQDENDVLGRVFDRLGYRVEGAVSSNERRVRALWEILSAFDQSSLVVNWWATYPAETIRGEMISNHLVPWSGFQTDTLAAQKNTDGLTAPAALTPLLLKRLNAYVEAHALENLERNAFTVAGYQYYKARDELVFEIYRDRMSQAAQAFSFATVYLQGVDTASHAYTTEVFGENVNEVRTPKISEEESNQLWDTLVAGAYRTMDQRLGTLLETRSENDLILLVSDHGWNYDGSSHWNQPDGIFMALGGPFRSNFPTRAHVFDILPTIIDLLGLPTSEELQGRALRKTLAPTWTKSHPKAMIASYGPRGSVIAVAPPADEEPHVDRLRDLGYVE